MTRFATLKIAERIFTIIFFISMLTTVINYMPVIEEEVSSKKHSQSHKCKNTDGGEPAGDEETDGSSEDLFHMPHALSVTASATKGAHQGVVLYRYIPPLPDMGTPPPRV